MGINSNKENHNLEEELRRFEHDNQSLIETNRQHELKIETLSTSLALNRKRLDHMENERENLRKDLHVTKDSLEYYISDLETANQNLNELKEENQQLRETVDYVRMEKRHDDENLDRHQRVAEDLSKRLEIMIRETDDSKLKNSKEIEDLNSRIMSLEEEKLNLITELDETTDDLK